MNLVGDRYGRWTVMEEAGRHRIPSGASFKLWRCRCNCGVERPVMQHVLRSGGSQSCGCLSREVASATFTKHGMHDAPEYHVWENMIQRCHNERHPFFSYYGGRGISVCPEWRASFTAFFEHIGPRPRPGLEIDRIDNDGNYEPGNVRWVTDAEQCQNKRWPRRRVSCL